jgi:hypothetical protein
VSPPAPSPPQIRAKRIKPRIPDEKTCIRIPLAHNITKSCQVRSRPNRSVRASAISDPLIIADKLANCFNLKFEGADNLQCCPKNAERGDVGCAAGKARGVILPERGRQAVIMFERSQASGGTESTLIVAFSSQRLLSKAVEVRLPFGIPPAAMVMIVKI